ncbi:MAG: GntR family transcriptional regulator [Rhizobiales bacterium]|nr:GntR family transcriptional regulator [Hyphomicrobiales bacterium]
MPKNRKKSLSDMAPVTAQKRTPTGERVYEEVRRMAVGYDFRPNERINEVELAARLNVSRSPVRESLQRLVTEGLITFQPSRGFFCRGLDVDQIVHLSDVRAFLEQKAVQLAAEHAPLDELLGLASWWHAVADRADSYSSIELTDKDEEFHMRIAQMSGNPELSRMIESINARIRFVREIEIEKRRRRSTTYTEHTDIADALSNRQGEKAGLLMYEHIRMSATDAMASVKDGLARIFLRTA